MPFCNDLFVIYLKFKQICNKISRYLHFIILHFTTTYTEQNLYIFRIIY
jgi:hypothetical protein